MLSGLMCLSIVFPPRFETGEPVYAGVRHFIELSEEMNDVIPMSQELYAALDYHGLLEVIVSDENTALAVISQGLQDSAARPQDECQEFQYKWGYAVVTDGKLVKAVRRTNPNAKWNT